MPKLFGVSCFFAPYCLLMFAIFTGLVSPLSAEGLQSSQGAAANKALNPDISANFLGLFLHGPGLSEDRTATPRNGLSIQEAEIQLTADVDPYFRGAALFSVSQEPGSTSYGIDPEELYVETLFLPSLTLRAGKFKLAFGKHNAFHTHAYPFIDAPLIQSIVFGDEGLNEVALSAAFLFPFSWYSEMVVQGFEPSNETLFKSPRSSNVGLLAKLKNLWDLTDDLTLELGLSGATGKNRFDYNSSVFGSDLTFKWRPSVGGKYQALVWSTEYIKAFNRGGANPVTGEPQEKLGGLASSLQYQFAQRWWIQTRYEILGIPHLETIPRQDKESILLGFYPSEFSGLRFQVSQVKLSGSDQTEHRLAFQYNVSIGAHPAHAY